MEILNSIKYQLQQNAIVAILVLVLILDILALPFLAMDSQKLGAEAPILKISEVTGPMIDSEAATDIYVVCTTLPTEVWVFLLLALGALLLFNFGYGLTHGERLQWKWELAFVMAALLAWCAWDSCQAAAWFPFIALKMSLLIFAGYLYLLEKKERFSNIPEEEYTESMF